MAEKIILKGVRLTYADLFQAVPRNKDKPEAGNVYKTGMLIPKDHPQLDELRAKVVAEAKKKHGEDWKKVLRKNDPIKDPEKEAEKDGEEVSPEVVGMYLINARAEERRKPQVVDKRLEPIFDENDAYSGCWANVSFAIYGFDRNNNKGVGFGLNNVQITKKDERLGGPASAKEDFEVMDDDGSDYGSTGDADDYPLD